jgi:hypothetical protein
MRLEPQSEQQVPMRDLVHPAMLAAARRCAPAGCLAPPLTPRAGIGTVRRSTDP